MPSTSAAIDTAIDTDAEDTEAVMFQTAIQRSMADTPGSPAVRGRGRKSDPGPSSQGARQDSGSPAKKSRKSSGGKVHIPTLRDYTSLQFPWCLIARAFLSQMKFKPVSYLDGVQGCVPDDSSTIDMKGQLTRIWNGEQAARCRFSENGQTWGLVYVPKGSPQALPPPALPVPTPALLATAVVKPASFTFVTNVPIRFREIYDLRAADWPGFIEERIMTNYRPMFPHLHATDRWRPLLPDDYHDPTVTLPYDSAHLVPVISAPTFARSWNALEQMDLDSLRANMKQYFRADGGVPVRTHSHIWWRQCGKATFLRQDTASQQHHLDRPLLLPLHDPEDPVVPPRDRRPLLLSAVRKVHRQPPVFGGITPTAIRFLNARAEEQSSYIMNSDAAAPHVMTYRSKRMRLYTGPYLENQDAQFPLRTLRVPELAAWGQRLATPLDFNVAYPVTDLSLRYTEALARLQIYQLSHREQSLAHLDFAFQQLIQIIAVMNPSFQGRAQSIADTALGRQWYLLMDDYATATELLQTTVHQRRQGFLSFATPACSEEDRKLAMQRPIICETRLLVPRVPATPPPPPPQPPRPDNATPKAATASPNPPPPPPPKPASTSSADEKTPDQQPPPPPPAP